MAPKTPKTKTTLLIDIAHTSVGVAVLAHTEGIQPRMLATWRESLIEDTALDRSFDTAVRLMRKLVGKANTAGYPVWDEVHCSVGTPWVLSNVRTAQYTSEKPVVVTKRLLQEIDDRDLERFFSVTPEAAGFADHRQLLEHQRLTVTVNGHRLQDPLGQRAKEITCTYLVTGIDPEYFEILQSALFVVTHREATIMSVQTAQWNSMRTLVGADNYLLIDFHGGFGECMMVKDGVLVHTTATELSEERYLTDIHQALGMQPHELRNMMRLRENGMLRSEIEHQIHNVETGMRIRYQEYVRELLADMSSYGLAPNRVFFLTSMGNTFFARVLADPQNASMTVLRSPLSPTELTVSLFADMIDAHACTKKDTALLLLALASLPTYNKQ